METRSSVVISTSEKIWTLTVVGFDLEDRCFNVNTHLHSAQDFEGVAGTYSADGNNGFTFEVASKTIYEKRFSLRRSS